MADTQDPPAWEECGTSMVVWLQGDHPGISEGTVDRTLCVTGIDAEYDTTLNVKVRARSHLNAQFFVYHLKQPRVGCQWAYSARDFDDLRPT